MWRTSRLSELFVKLVKFLRNGGEILCWRSLLDVEVLSRRGGGGAEEVELPAGKQMNSGWEKKEEGEEEEEMFLCCASV